MTKTGSLPSVFRPVVVSSVILPLVLLSCGTHQVVTDEHGNYLGRGATYYLPRTVILASVPIVKKEEKPGELAPFAPVLFFKAFKDKEEKPKSKGAKPGGGKKDVAAAPASVVTFSIGDDITLDAAGERDLSKHYTSVFVKGFTKSATQVYTWNDQGGLSSGQASVENKTADFVVSTLEAGVKIASAAGGALSMTKGTQENQLYPNVAGLQGLCDFLNGLDKGAASLETNGLRWGLAHSLPTPNGNSNSNFTPGGTSPSNRITPPGQNPLNPATPLPRYDDTAADAPSLSKAALDSKKAWEAFEENHPHGLAAFRLAISTYNNIQSGLSSANGVQNPDIRKAILADVDTAMSKFLGKSTESTTVIQFRWTPPAYPSSKAGVKVATSGPLFKLNSSTGVDFTGGASPEKTPDRDKITNKGSGGTVSEISLQAISTTPGDQSKWDHAAKIALVQGWYYSIPADATVSLVVKKAGEKGQGAEEIKAVRRQGLAQHGIVGFLPATGGGAKVVSDIDLDPATGALKKLTQGTVAFDPALVTRTGAAIGSEITSERNANKASDAAFAATAATAASASDPLTKLRREKEEWELKAAIKKAKEAAGDAGN